MARAPGSMVSTSFTISGLAGFLNALQRSDERFKKELKSAGKSVAEGLVSGAQARAGGARNATVASALFARSDRFPTVQLRRRNFRAARNGSAAARISDVFFGAEFGGRGSKRTMQFDPHRGRNGYFFWPTVRARRGDIADEYLRAIQDVLDTLKG